MGNVSSACTSEDAAADQAIASGRSPSVIEVERAEAAERHAAQEAQARKAAEERAAVCSKRFARLQHQHQHHQQQSAPPQPASPPER
jgi:predicted alpha/beta superfamily hydrolase